jgi:hypothetical protein
MTQPFLSPNPCLQQVAWWNDLAQLIPGWYLKVVAGQGLDLISVEPSRHRAGEVGIYPVATTKAKVNTNV